MDGRTSIPAEMSGERERKTGGYSDWKTHMRELLFRTQRIPYWSLTAQTLRPIISWSLCVYPDLDKRASLLALVHYLATETRDRKQVGRIGLTLISNQAVHIRFPSCIVGVSSTIAAIVLLSAPLLRHSVSLLRGSPVPQLALSAFSSVLPVPGLIMFIFARLFFTISLF